MIFMGEEFGAETPFLFFCDFEKDLAAAVTKGRRAEFSHFAAFSNPADREQIPDPNAATTFEASRLDWSAVAQPQHQEWLCFHRTLLKLRREHVVSRLATACKLRAVYAIHGDCGLSARWKFPDNSELTLQANLGIAPLSGFATPGTSQAGRVIYTNEEVSVDTLKRGILPPWSVVWSLEP
jgi:1,4-alpha-glucan branching enzyme